MPAKISAGLLMFRRSPESNETECFIAHPGGPYWRNRNDGAWTIPKGAPENDEDLEETARREFREETGLSPHDPLIPLGHIRQKGGKTIHAWAFEGDWDPATGIESNTFEVEWPPRSGRVGTYPEIDRARWATPNEARRLLNPAQADLVDRLLEHLGQSERT